MTWSLIFSDPKACRVRALGPEIQKTPPEVHRGEFFVFEFFIKLRVEPHPLPQLHREPVARLPRQLRRDQHQNRFRSVLSDQ